MEFLLRAISENDAETLRAWREKWQEKVNLTIARRMLRMEMILEARAGEQVLEVRSAEGSARVAPKSAAQVALVIEEAKRRACDPKAFNKIMEDSMAEFERASTNTLKDIHIMFSRGDIKITEEKLREIYRDNTEANCKILEEVRAMSLDEIDECIFEGRSLEDYCFDD